MSVYRHASSRSVGIGVFSKVRHAERRFSASQAGSPFNAESACMASALIPLLLRTSGTPFVLIYHPSLKDGGGPSNRSPPHPKLVLLLTLAPKPSRQSPPSPAGSGGSARWR